MGWELLNSVKLRGRYTTGGTLQMWGFLITKYSKMSQTRWVHLAGTGNCVRGGLGPVSPGEVGLWNLAGQKGVMADCVFITPKVDTPVPIWSTQREGEEPSQGSCAARLALRAFLVSCVSSSGSGGMKLPIGTEG